MNLKKLKKNEVFFKLMDKKKQSILLFFLFFFSVYCALVIGKSWDEGFAIRQGKSTLDYLFSLGKINEYFWGREYYSGIYWSLQYLLTTTFPLKYQIEINHLVNLIFSLAAIVGISQLGKELFNKKVGKIVFLILFFYPIFFGHMSINSKDTILAFSHVWIALLLIKYLRNQNYRKKSNVNNYVISIGVLAALSTGIQIFFIGSLIPFFLFALIEIFLFKKIVNENFNKKKFFYDLAKCFLVFYFLLIIFWIDVHQNLVVLPFKIFIAALNNTYMTGWPFNLVNGEYYLSHEVPKLYFLTNIIYKSPEYLLITYIFFLILILKSNLFFKKKFINFNYKLYLILFILIFPNVVALIIPFPLYDGMRLFLWTIPYFCIIPALTIYYLIENFNNIKSKLGLFFLIPFIIYFLFNFFIITPYQYTYLNIFNGESKNRYKKFENDYWGASIKELINRSKLENKKVLKISTCGINAKIAKLYLNKKKSAIYKFVDHAESDYLIMTNRVTSIVDENKGLKKMVNCFDKYKGNDVVKVSRNGLVLSVIRKVE